MQNVLSFFGFTKYNLYKYTHLNNISSHKLIILYGSNLSHRKCNETGGIFYIVSYI